MPVAVDHRNHVGGVLGDEFKKLVPLRQFPPNSLQLQMLINGVDVEQEYEAGQRAHPLLEIKPVSAIRSRVRAGEAERHDTGCQHQPDGHGKSPEPPLAPSTCRIRFTVLLLWLAPSLFNSSFRHTFHRDSRLRKKTGKLPKSEGRIIYLPPQAVLRW